MTVFQSIILGIVQGLTEFIPVSSSAHLLIIPRLFGWQDHSLAFDTTLHLGTSLALIIYFFDEIKQMVLSFLIDTNKLIASKTTKDFKFESGTVLSFKVILGALPALILGLVFGDYFETTFREIVYTPVFLLAGSILMLLAEYFYNRIGKKTLSGFGYAKSLLVGLFQSLALLPGFSRSGSTLSGSMFMGLSKEDSAKYSFLIGLPVILSAGLYQLVSNPMSDLLTLHTIIGFITSFIFGFAAIKFLMNFLKTNNLYPFIIYRVLLAVFLVLSVSHLLSKSLML